MKKLLISLTLLFLVLSAFAQSNRDVVPHLSSPTAKGTIILSGSTNLSFASINNEAKLTSDYGGDSFEYDSNNFSFSPSIGWFVADGLALAITMDYESLKQENEEESYKESSFLFGPSVTYYFGSSNIKPFILGEYLFGSTKEDDDVEETTVSVNGWGLGGGVAFFLNQHISLNLGLGYAKMTAKPEDIVGYDVEITSKGIAFDAGLSIYF